MNAYESLESVRAYEDFLATENGQIFKQIMTRAILARLPAGQRLTVLDAGCGNGWLTHELQKAGHRPFGCDASAALIGNAKELYPEIAFTVADLTKPLPYPQEQFDAAVLNMVIHDLEDQQAALKNIFGIIKSGGFVIATAVNPYYGYPVGVWKRGLWGFLLRKKPTLKLQEFYNRLKTKKDRSYTWNEHLHSRFYSLSEHLNNFVNAGFSLNFYQELHSHDDQHFNLHYQLNRYPIIILIEFKKL